MSGARPARWLDGSSSKRVVQEGRCALPANLFGRGRMRACKKADLHKKSVGYRPSCRCRTGQNSARGRCVVGWMWPPMIILSSSPRRFGIRSQVLSLVQPHRCCWSCVVQGGLVLYLTFALHLNCAQHSNQWSDDSTCCCCMVLGNVVGYALKDWPAGSRR